MSDRVLDQLAAYGDLHRLHQKPVTMADLAERGNGRLVPEPLPRRRRTWRILVAAVMTTVLVIAGIALLQERGGHEVRTEPVGSSPSPAASPSTTSVPPARGAWWEGLVPPEGTATSTPDSGELVASVALIHGGAYHLYADGRLISLNTTTSEWEWIEQRLSPESVERVRSEFVASGLFDRTQPVSDPQCEGVFRVCVRDGGRLLSVTAPKLEQAPGTGNLLSFMRHLDSWLPATGWVDQRSNKYAASNYSVCFAHRAIDGTVFPDGTNLAAVPDPSAIWPMLPTPMANVLNRPAPPGSGIDDGTCFVVTTDEARLVADETDKTFGIVPSSRDRFDGFLSGFVVGEPEPITIMIAVTPLLPDGLITNFPG